MESKSNKILSVSAALFILVLTIVLCVLPKKIYSENENRYLAKFPKFSIENVLNGKFMSGIEDYVVDHFPLRDFFVGGKTTVELLIGKDENKGVYFAEDDYLIQKYTTPNLAKYDSISKAVNKLESNNEEFNISFLLAPTSNYVNSDLKPKFNFDKNENDSVEYFYSKLNSDVNTINVNEALYNQNKNQQLYFKLDHHWNTHGAYYAYIEYCKSVGLTPTSISDYNIEEVTDEFYGTFFSKVNHYSAKPDNIELYYPKTAQKLTVNYVANEKVTNTLYEMSYLETKDKYSVFLNNNPPLIEITNHDIEDGSSLLILKDSYANAFIPFLTMHYENIYVIDPRYYALSISEYAKEKGVKDILFLYNVANIETDTALVGIK